MAKNEESIQILSKHQGWIHVSPKTNNRSNPLEKKTLDEEKHRKILPNWMNIKIDKKQKDLFKSYPNILINKNNNKMMILFDKNLDSKINKSISSHRSIFNYQDFRNNVILEEERKFFDNMVSKEPKKFFDWDDKKVFNAKSKKDI